MHELAMTHALIEAAERAVEDAVAAGDRRVLGLKVSLGGLSCASAEALRFCFDLLAPGTRLDGAALRIEEKPTIGHCQDCGADSEIDAYFTPCPACGGANVTLDAHADVLLESIELED